MCRTTETEFKMSLLTKSYTGIRTGDLYIKKDVAISLPLCHVGHKVFESGSVESVNLNLPI